MIKYKWGIKKTCFMESNWNGWKSMGWNWTSWFFSYLMTFSNSVFKLCFLLLNCMND
jgi:hypothetical protein